MKRIFVFVTAVVLAISILGEAKASLTAYNSDIVYDGTRYWVRDLSQFVEKTYDQQQTWVSTNINNNAAYTVINNNWHMASNTEMQTLWAYSAESIGGIFGPSGGDPPDPDINYPGLTFWYGRYDELFWTGNHHYYVAIGYDNVSEWSKTGLLETAVIDSHSGTSDGAWVTTTVPIPSALLLLGSGLFGVVALRRKFKS
jgi:hypothetical protein